MILDNTFRVCLNQPKLLWKVFLYQIVWLIIVFGITLASCYSLVEQLVANGFFESVGKFFTDNILNIRLDVILANVSSLVDQLWSIILENSEQLLPLIILFFIIVIILGAFIISLMEIPLIETVYCYMGSCVKLNFLGCYISNFKRSIKYAFARLVTTLPIDIIIIIATIFSLKLFILGGIVSMIAPFIIVLLFVLLVSLRQSLFALWTPAIVVANLGVWQGLKVNFKLVFKNFRSIFSAHLMVIILVFAINFGLGILTCGVGFIISMPATVVYYGILSNILYFHYNGLRYYIDKDRIISPKKMEERERITDIKFIV